MRQWPWHWAGWQQNASILLDMRRIASGQLDPMQALAAIPATRIAEMQVRYTHRSDLGARPPPPERRERQVTAT